MSPRNPAERENGRREPSPAERLVEVAERLYEFRKTHEGGNIAIPKSGARVALPIGEALKGRLSAAEYQETGKVVSASAVDRAVQVCVARGSESPPVRAAFRTARHESGFCLDLGQSSGEVVSVQPEGWEMLDRSPVLFTNSELTAALPTPIPRSRQRKGLARLRRLLNMGYDTFLLLAYYLAISLIPEQAHPILLLTGEPGAGKSTALRLCRSLVDPSPALTQAPPRTEEGWILTSSGSRVVAYDNVSDIPPWQSDALCRVVDGGAAHVLRHLYTTNSRAVIRVQRVVMINGIDPRGLRGDLIDRSLVVELERIPSAARRGDHDIERIFAKYHGHILGSLLDLAVTAIAGAPEVELQEYPRMADFARHLAALDQARGTDTLGTYLMGLFGSERGLEHP